MVLFDRFFFLCKLSGAYAMCKKLEKRDVIVDVREVGLEPNAGAVLLPLGPVGTVQFFITGRDSGFHCCPDRTVVSVYSSANVRGRVATNFAAGIWS